MMHQGAFFDGPDVNEEDEDRLTHQLGRVRSAMKNFGWWTLDELAFACRATPQGVSARVRDLRKARFGGLTVDRRRHPTKKGVFQYRMLPF